MDSEFTPFDKAAAKTLIERRLRWLGLTKRELAAHLAISAGVLSRRLGERYAYERFSIEEIAGLADLLQLDASQTAFVQQCHGHASGRATAPPHPPRATEPETMPPLPLTSFIGRAWELGEIRRLLGESRLLTLTGIGGCGKTRLALHVATEPLPEATGGVCFVELATLRDGSLVAQRVGEALGVREEAGVPLEQTLARVVATRRLLLILDNAEHLAAACAALATSLLRTCPHLRLLVTSRVALGAAGETLLRVPPLSLPPDTARHSWSGLAESEAAQLFVARARLQQPGFGLDEANAAAVAQICRRLDGLPLALELAAARVSVLSAQQIAQRLDGRFRLLTGGRSDSPRQQTLAAAMDWSHELLSVAERTLLRRLAVFAPDFGIEAIESVGAAPVDAQESLDLLGQLVAQSLVVVEQRGGEARYRLLETVREYAEARLAAAGERAALVARHRQYYLDLAERAAPELGAAGQQAWLDRLESEHEQLRLVLRRSATAAEWGAVLRLGGALWRFWEQRGYLTEGRRWLEAALEHDAGGATPLRARALVGAGALARAQGDGERARAALEEGLAILRRLDDASGVAVALTNLGNVARDQNHHAEARRSFEAALGIRRQLRDVDGIGRALNNLGVVAYDQGDLHAARAAYEESLSIWRALGHRFGTALLLDNLGLVARTQERPAEARTLHMEALAIRREQKDRLGIANSTYNLGMAAFSEEEFDEAEQHFWESLILRVELEHHRGEAECLLGLAAVAAAHGRPESAAHLLGAAEALRESSGIPLLPAEQAGYERTLARVHAALDAGALTRAWARGRTSSPEQILDALAVR